MVFVDAPFYGCLQTKFEGLYRVAFLFQLKLQGFCASMELISSLWPNCTIHVWLKLR